MGRLYKYISLLFCIVILSCKESRRENLTTDGASVTPKFEGQSILDYEYVNDTLDLRIKDFRVVKLSDSIIRFDVYVETPHREKYRKDHVFFIHGYMDTSKEAEAKFLNLDTREVMVNANGQLVYSRAYKNNVEYFNLIRYGLLNNKGKRLFTLRLDSIYIFDEHNNRFSLP